MNTRRWIWIVLLAALLLVKLVCRHQARMERDRERTEINNNRDRQPLPAPPSPETDRHRPQPPSPEAFPGREELNRHATSLIYTRHAKCRMACRHIDQDEVLEILRMGEINYQKSDLRAQPDPKYALEGTTRDSQRVRIIFANSPRGIVVVTVIDLDRDWTCHCD